MLKGIGKNILGAFVDLESSEQAAPAQPAQAVAKPGTPPVKGPAPAAPAYPSVNPEMLEVLQKKISGRVTPYTALLENAETLKDVIPDETMRLNAAYKMVSKDGRTVASITSAIDVHLSDLEGERMRFKQMTDKQIKDKSGALRGQAEAAEAAVNRAATDIERLEAQIAKLREEIVTNQQRSHELKQEADAAEADIINTANAFEATVEYVKQDLQNKKVSLGSLLSK